MGLGLESLFEKFDDVRGGGVIRIDERKRSAYPSHLLLDAVHLEQAGFRSSHLTRRALMRSEDIILAHSIETRTKDLVTMTDLQVTHPLFTLGPLFRVSFRRGFSLTSAITNGLQSQVSTSRGFRLAMGNVLWRYSIGRKVVTVELSDDWTNGLCYHKVRVMFSSSLK